MPLRPDSYENRMNMSHTSEFLLGMSNVDHDTNGALVRLFRESSDDDGDVANTHLSNLMIKGPQVMQVILFGDKFFSVLLRSSEFKRGGMQL